MTDNPQDQYLKAKIMTATSEQLQAMLYDGAIRFCEQAKHAMQAKNIPDTHDRLVRAQRIVLELSSSLRTDVDPELCGKLTSLYNYVYRLLIDANINRDVGKVDEALQLLHYQRDTWTMAMEELRRQQADPSPSRPERPAARNDADNSRAASQATTPPPAGDELIGGTLSIEG